MRKSIISFFIILILLALASALLFTYPMFKAIEKRATTNLASVYATVPVGESAVAGALHNLFKNHKNSPSDKFGRFIFVPAGDQVFPSDFQIQADASSKASLQRYTAIDPVLRQKDFYLYEPTGDYYWESEYYYQDAPAKFRCHFIIHAEAEGNSNTRIEVFEYQPRIWVGKKFGVSGHSGPGFYNDIREVEPTTTDRLELLDIMKHAINRLPENQPGS
jgi:hypothetical protein